MKKTIFFLLFLGANFVFAQVLPDSTQLRALEKFRKDNVGNWIVRWDYKTGLPASVFGGRANMKGNNPETAARKFLQKYSELFKIDPDNSNFKSEKITRRDKMYYVSFRQVYHNIPVYGAKYIITTEPNGNILSAKGRYYPVAIYSSTTASLNKDEAFNRAKNDFGNSKKLKLFRSNLFILPHNGKFRLAWKLDISTETPGDSWMYCVDANNGEVLKKQKESSDAVETDRPDYKPSVSVEKVNSTMIQPSPNSAELFGEVNGLGNIYETYPLQNEFGLSTGVTLPRMSDATGYVIGTYADVDNSAVSRANNIAHDYTGISIENPQFDEVNVYYHMDKFRWEYINKFNFTGFTQLKALVNLPGEGAQFNNLSSPISIQFDHSDPTLPHYAREAKIIYHEYTHAVVYTINGLLSWPNEAGGINEGLADYFAGSYTNNTLMGVYAYTGNKRIRDMSNPLKSQYSDFLIRDAYKHIINEDPHISGEFFSSILWNIRNGIGQIPDTTDLLIFNSLNGILTNTNFLDFRDAMMNQSWSQLQKDIIQNKFAEKGVGDFANNPPGAPVNLTITAALGESPTLSWTPPNDPDISYYKLYRQKPSDLNPVYFALTSATFLTDYEVTRTGNFLNDDIKYYAKTVDEEGLPSTSSNIVNLLDTYSSGGGFSANPALTKETVETGKFIPDKFNLQQNYPNPFNPSTTITFDIPTPAYVTLEVYNINGQKIKTLADEQKQPGRYTFNFNGNRLASGVYIIRLTAGNFVKSMPIILLK